MPDDDSRDDEDPLHYGDVLLFVERKRASALNVSTDARVLASIAGICRRLDGIPMAIELAAPRATAISVEGLAAGLDGRFRLLTGGRRMGCLDLSNIRGAAPDASCLAPLLSDRLMVTEAQARDLRRHCPTTLTGQAELSWKHIVKMLERTRSPPAVQAQDPGKQQPPQP